MSAWYYERGPESDVVISSRVRLARNLKDYPFPHRMSRQQEAEVVGIVRDSILNNSKSGMEFTFINMNEISPLDRQAMVEKHLISPEMTESGSFRGLLLSSDEKVSIMINEEDHLRIQCLYPGLNLAEAWQLCNSMDDLLEQKVEYAFDERYGYLTCCPTNAGTGIRASVMLHLPALIMTGYIKNVLEVCAKIGIAVRGLYGEHSEATGNMFQLSNQVTMGQSEQDIVESITGIATQVIEQERMLRKELYRQNPIKIEDTIYRSLGVFSNARIISSEESLKLLSDIRLGVEMGIIKDITIEKLNEIMLKIQPANLQKVCNRQLTPEERDVQRAELIRKLLTT